jgi:hypothetical protein
VGMKIWYWNQKEKPELQLMELNLWKEYSCTEQKTIYINYIKK